MTPTRVGTVALTVAGITLTAFLATAQSSAPSDRSRRPELGQVEMGAYLVSTMGCHDCHTPFRMGPKGPEPDMSRALTGHPESLRMPPPPVLPAGPWMMVSAATNTAHAGPWGVSYTANLTPDKETGLGDWTEAQFIATMRTGKHQGKGRPVLPPMPYQMLGALTDPEIAAVWAYLRSLPPVRNRVPAPVDPAEAS